MKDKKKVDKGNKDEKTRKNKQEKKPLKKVE